MMQEPVSTVNPSLAYIVLVILGFAFFFMVGAIREDGVYFGKCMHSFHDERLCERYVTNTEEE